MTGIARGHSQVRAEPGIESRWWCCPPQHSSDALKQRFPTFLAPGTSFTEDSFSMAWGGGWERWFGDDSSALHLLYTLFLLLFISFISDHQALDPESWGPLP